jgi:hypothetical protein
METLCGRLTEKTLRTFLQVIPSRHLTPAVSGRRPDETIHVQSKPHAGGDALEGRVRLSSGSHDCLSLPWLIALPSPSEIAPVHHIIGTHTGPELLGGTT